MQAGRDECTADSGRVFFRWRAEEYGLAACGRSQNPERNIPRRLKPPSFWDTYGTTKVVPFQNQTFTTGHLWHDSSCALSKPDFHHRRITGGAVTHRAQIPLEST